MTTVTVQQNVGGYSGTIDTFLRESRPTNSYTTATSIDVDGVDSSNAKIQGLLMFSGLFGNGPGQIPLGSTITSATLMLSLTDGTKSPVSFYRMAQDWTALPALTWNSFGGGIQTDGTEALSTADVSLSGLATGSQSINVLQSLQAWSNGAANNGWMLSSGGSDGFAFSSSEGTNTPILTVTYDTPTNPLPGLTIVQSGGTTIVTEGGADDSLSIALKSAPLSDVTITISTTGVDDINVAPIVLTFTTQNWATAQIAIFGAINDTVYEGQETFNVTLATTSTDQAYNGLSSGVLVAVNDDDLPPPPPPGLNVVESGGTTVISEGGAGDIVSIALKAAPTSDVTIVISTSGSGDINIAPTVLTFTAQNWATPQAASLGAINDTVVEGPETFNVTLTATSADQGYNGLTSNVSVLVNDNDVAVPPIAPTLVAVHDTTGDPSGIAYVPSLDLLFIVDSEHDESPYFSLTNLFTTHLDGSLVDSISMRGFTREPSGIAYNSINGLLYISDDDADKIFLVDPNNPTVKVGEINLKPYGITDAEDPAIDPLTGHIFMLDGYSRSLIELTATGGLIQKTVLPTAIKDAEALAYDAAHDVFYIASGATRGTIFQTDHSGNILATIELLNNYVSPISGSRPKIKGLELALSSDPNDGNKMSLYAVDYGVDQKPDGRVFEIDLHDNFLFV